MPSIPVHPPSPARRAETDNPLPQLLQTPSGLAIVEIQGTIHTPAIASSLTEGDSASAIGQLVFPLYSASNPAEDTAWQKRVYMYVGKHQRLTGEVKKLAKPLAVLRRRRAEDTEQSYANPLSQEELEIAEIIQYKVLFAHRPEPVGGGGEQ